MNSSFEVNYLSHVNIVVSVIELSETACSIKNKYQDWIHFYFWLKI